MAWLRVGDNIATHPLMSRLTEACEYDHALKNEAFGLFIALATVSAGHLTDYVVEPGLVGQFAPGREKMLLDVLRDAGLVENFKTVEKITDKDEVKERTRWLYKLENDIEFVHMRSKKEIEIDRDRARDRRNPELRIPVRLRDGDQCRWCGNTVNFADRKSNRGGTIDSLNNHEDSTIETLVVACRGCNAGREETPDKYKLLPPPSEPHYEQSTITWINNHSWSQANGIKVPEPQAKLDFTQAAADESGAPVTEADVSLAAAQEAAPSTSSPGRPGADLHEAAPVATPQPVAPRHREEEPAWMHEPVKVNRGNQAAADESGAPVAEADVSQAAAQEAAPSTSSPGQSGADLHEAAPKPKDNETIKPDADQDQITADIRDSQGDVPRLSGSGRVGSGRDDTVRDESVQDGRRGGIWPARKRRRGKRGGKKR